MYFCSAKTDKEYCMEKAVNPRLFHLIALLIVEL